MPWIPDSCVEWRLRDAPKSLLGADGEELRQDFLDRLVDAKLCGASMQIASHSPDSLPTRELPHGNMATLFVVYNAWCKAAQEPPASRTVFYKAAKKWKVCLRFHKDSNHSKCLTCMQLQSAMDNAKVPFQQMCVSSVVSLRRELH